MNEKYDSKIDTLEHKQTVAKLITEFCETMLKRAVNHDNSKLDKVEKDLFDIETPVLKTLTYGTPEYKESLKRLGVALEHHYKHNSHHPEHYENGIDDMDIFDIVEMLFDWRAASLRHTDGDVLKSIEINKKRFNMSDQLVKIFENTAKKLNWGKSEK